MTNSPDPDAPLGTPENPVELTEAEARAWRGLVASAADAERADAVGDVDMGQPNFTYADILRLAANPPEWIQPADRARLKRQAVQEADHQRQVRFEVARLRVRREAEAALTGQVIPDPPDLLSLTAFLAEPDEDVAYLVDGLWPTGGRIVLAAQNKSGKTTLTGNLVRCLADGDPLLGRFTTQQVPRVILIDNEMSPGQIRRWLRDQGIKNTDAVEVVSLRGALSSFNILDPATRQEWATRLGRADVLVFDCLRPALDALGLSEDKDAGRFLEALDELVLAAGVDALCVVHHMGHANERSRGDSRLEDWPDAKWKLVKEDADDPNSPRYFSAFGRDVEQGEVRLSFNPENRHLSVAGGSRRNATADRVGTAVLAFITDNPGCSGGAIRKAITGDNSIIDDALRALLAADEIRVEKQGPGRATLHYIVDPEERAAWDFSTADLEEAQNREDSP